MVRVWNSPDLTPLDRRRVALLVKAELDSVSELGAVPKGDRSIEAIAFQHLPARDDDRLTGLTLASLLA